MSSAPSMSENLGSDRPVSVLIVEDDESLRPLFVRMLRRAGFAVDSAVHGLDGLQQFRNRPADLVITDIMMPQMDGFELIRTLVSEAPAVRIVAMTAGDYHTLLPRAIELGATAVVRKPLNAAELVQTAERALIAAS
jgi:two-component system, chemotaxis family, chemotaxis protein CheY